MTPRIQIIGRLSVELNRGVRAAAKHQKVSFNTFLTTALTQAVAAPRPTRAKTGA
jgi:predicted HicB family RNase H-like nuclease